MGEGPFFSGPFFSSLPEGSAEGMGGQTDVDINIFSLYRGWSGTLLMMLCVEL